MLNIAQFRKHIIIPALSKLQMYSKDAEELLVFTCATESNGGSLLVQVQGPALGIFQMEPVTYADIWNNYIFNRSSLLTLISINFAASNIPNATRMVYDLQFATVMARIHYRRFAAELPKSDDVDGIWDYYKKYFNTPLGKSEKDKSIADYKRFLKS